MNERYNFEWSQYHLQSKTLLQNIYERSDFHDVTLVTDDERFIKSHKVVLAANGSAWQKRSSVAKIGFVSQRLDFPA